MSKAKKGQNVNLTYQIEPEKFFKPAVSKIKHLYHTLNFITKPFLFGVASEKRDAKGN